VAKKKKRRRKNRFKPISENQIIRINLDYTDEENDIDLRGNRYYLVTSFRTEKNDKLIIKLFVITTRKNPTTKTKNKFLRDKWFTLKYKIKKLPNCLPNVSLIDQYLLITLRLEPNKYRHHLCYTCPNFCLDSEEYIQITNEHEEY